MKIKKTLVFVLMLSLMIATFSFPVSAAEIPEREVLLSVIAGDAPEFILSELSRDSVVYNEDSVIEIVKDNLHDSSFLVVTTNEGEICRKATVISLAEEDDGTPIQGNFAENLLLSPMDSSFDYNTWEGTKITSECVYTLTIPSDMGLYYRPVSSNFICTNTGTGTRPSNVNISVNLGGTLCNMSTNPPTVIDSEYRFTNTSFSKIDPAFSQRYSYAYSFPANRAVLPGYFFGRFVMVTTAVINGKTFYSPLPIAYNDK